MDNPFKKASVIGLGYIGLPCAAMIASRGIHVIGVEVSEETVNTINAGKVHIIEPDLDMIVQSTVAMGRLKATTQPEEADVFLLAVPTPFTDQHIPDLHYIEDAVRAIAPVLCRGNLVILESTVPVGTTEHVAAMFADLRPDLQFPQNAGEEADINIAHCPERVLPGQILQELVTNDRIIGGMTRRCAERATSFYELFVKGECIETDSRTAEMAKLSENAFRDVNIAFANELALICDKLRIDVWELIRVANRHPRVNILSPGPGVGGHCIAVDPWFIIHSAPDQSPLMQTARRINDEKPAWVVERVLQTAAEFKKPIVACLGLSFKADIDDLRQSPALAIVEQLSERIEGELLIVEPHIRELPQNLRDRGLSLVRLDEALDKANMVLVLVDHRAFKKLPVGRVSTKAVIDTRGIW